MILMILSALRMVVVMCISVCIVRTHVAETWVVGQQWIVGALCLIFLYAALGRIKDEP